MCEKKLLVLCSRDKTRPRINTDLVLKLLMNVVDKGGCCVSAASIPVIYNALSKFFSDAKIGGAVSIVCFACILS